jgi:beta-galactosidase
MWAESLHILNDSALSQPVARYGQPNGWLDEQIAILYNTCERGGVYYVGAYLDENAQAKLIEHICKFKGIKPLMDTPQGVEVCQRVTPAGQEIFILINHQNHPRVVTIPWEAHEHLSGGRGKGELTLTPYGVAILTKVESGPGEIHPPEAQSAQPSQEAK